MYYTPYCNVATQRGNKGKAVKYPYFPTIMLITCSVVENYERFDIFILTMIPNIIPNMKPNVRHQIRTWEMSPFMVGIMVGIMVGL